MQTYVMVFGHAIPSYGLLMSVALLLCAFLSYHQLKHHGLPIEDFLIISGVSLGMGLLGAGLLYILVSYSSEQIFQMLRQGDFSFLTQGGLVFYGGLLGGILGGLTSCRILQQDVSLLERCIVPVLPLGHAIGRMGCLLAGCCHGREYDGWLAVPNYTLSLTTRYFPVQSLEAVCNLGLVWLLFFYAKKVRPRYHILCHYLIFYAVLRFIMELFRGDFIRGGFLYFSTSQWISIALFVLSLGKLCYDTLQCGNQILNEEW